MVRIEPFGTGVVDGFARDHGPVRPRWIYWVCLYRERFETTASHQAEPEVGAALAGVVFVAACRARVSSFLVPGADEFRSSAP